MRKKDTGGSTEGNYLRKQWKRKGRDVEGNEEVQERKEVGLRKKQKEKGQQKEVGRKTKEEVRKKII